MACANMTLSAPGGAGTSHGLRAWVHPFSASMLPSDGRLRGLVPLLPLAAHQLLLKLLKSCRHKTSQHMGKYLASDQSCKFSAAGLTDTTAGPTDHIAAVFRMALAPMPGKKRVLPLEMFTSLNLAPMHCRVWPGWDHSRLAPTHQQTRVSFS